MYIKKKGSDYKVSNKNLCEIKTAFIIALDKQYNECLSSKSKLSIKYDLSALRDMVEDFGIKDEITDEDMNEIVLSDNFLLEVCKYAEVEKEFTSGKPNESKIKDIIRQWAMITNIIRKYNEQESGRHEYPEDFVLRSART